MGVWFFFPDRALSGNGPWCFVVVVVVCLFVCVFVLLDLRFERVFFYVLYIICIISKQIGESSVAVVVVVVFTIQQGKGIFSCLLRPYNGDVPMHLSLLILRYCLLLCYTLCKKQLTLILRQKKNTKYKIKYKMWAPVGFTHNTCRHGVIDPQDLIVGVQSWSFEGVMRLYQILTLLSNIFVYHKLIWPFFEPNNKAALFWKF